ncbi:hypothetical protein AKO1_015606 [Acrasis kona]|uniref:EamA domain-containing protein n=1 Tax=Acrasis kona TaxID=1008807 RepID=A0AAW2ZGF4_9EUKA
MVVTVKQQLTTHFLLLVANFAYSCAYVIAKTPLKVIHPLHYTSIRSLISTILMLLFWIVRDFNFSFEYRKQEQNKERQSWVSWTMGKIPNSRDALLLGLSGFFLIPLNQNLNSAGLVFVDGVVAGAIQPSVVVFTAIISIILGNEAKSGLKFFGMLLSVVGATCMVMIKINQSDSVLELEISRDSIIGTCLFLGNCLCYSIAMNINRYLQDHHNMSSTVVSVWSSIFGCLFSCVLSLMFYSLTDFTKCDLYCVLGVFYHGSVASAFPYMINVFAVGLLSPVVMSIYITTIPIFSVIIDYVLYERMISISSILAISTIIAGVFLVGYSKHQESKGKEQIIMLDMGQPQSYSTDVLRRRKY